MVLNKIRVSFALATVGFMILSGCAGDTQETGNTEKAQPVQKETSPLLNPKAEAMNQTAPDNFKAKFVTSKGEFVIEAHRVWSPTGVDRFYNLVKNGFYEDVRFFRNIAGFMVQFGIHGDPKIASIWNSAGIADDPVVQSSTRGRVTFAKKGTPNSRSTQLFISFGDNSNLDQHGFAAFGEVVEGMEIVDSLYNKYGEAAPRGSGPDQGRIIAEGNEYLKASFPNLDYIVKATIVE